MMRLRDSKGLGNLLRFSYVSLTNLHTQRFSVAVSFRRKLLTLRQLYPRAPSRPSVSPFPMGRTSASTSLMPQLVQAVILPQHGAFVNILRINCVSLTSSHTRRDVFVDSKGSVNLLRINCVLPTSLHTRRDASAEINPPVALSSIHSPTLGRV